MTVSLPPPTILVRLAREPSATVLSSLEYEVETPPAPDELAPELPPDVPVTAENMDSTAEVAAEEAEEACSVASVEVDDRI